VDVVDFMDKKLNTLFLGVLSVFMELLEEAADSD
jgi:hypothetical protein